MVIEAMERERAQLLERAAQLAQTIAELRRFHTPVLPTNDVAPSPAVTQQASESVTAATPSITPPAVVAPVEEALANLFDEPPPHPESSGPGPRWRSEPFDGTFASLVRHYRWDKGSPYFKLHWKVRKNYDLSINRLVRQIGHERLSDLSAARIQELYEGWKEGGKVASAHSLVGKLRLIASFGTLKLNDDACAKLSIILSKMEFEMPEARHERLTQEQAIAIRIKAHEMGRQSIALAQAFQYDLKIKQVDLIGEWVPLDLPGESDEIWGDQKWMRGLSWSHIDDDLILRRTVSARKPYDIEVDLKTMPMVMEELQHVNASLRKGPVIVNEWTGKAWATAEFRRWWRKVADEAGVPKTVRNMDNRDDPDPADRPVRQLSSKGQTDYLN